MKEVFMAIRYARLHGETGDRHTRLFLKIRMTDKALNQGVHDWN